MDWVNSLWLLAFPWKGRTNQTGRKDSKRQSQARDFGHPTISAVATWASTSRLHLSLACSAAMIAISLHANSCANTRRPKMKRDPHGICREAAFLQSSRPSPVRKRGLGCFLDKFFRQEYLSKHSRNDKLQLYRRTAPNLAAPIIRLSQRTSLLGVGNPARNSCLSSFPVCDERSIQICFAASRIFQPFKTPCRVCPH